MITLHLKIADSPPNGVAIEILSFPDNPSVMEFAHYQAIEMGLKTVCQLILEGASSGTMIEGAAIDKTVRAMFDRLTQKPSGQ
jgi:hypothetical protein